MASEMGSSSSSQDVTPVPVIALAQSQNELLLPPNNCPNCKVLSRHLKISREWNNFFRLKLDQRDMLLHVAADYKRQKQRCLQLQMSLDQQSRECGEMRDQLTSLLLEVNPLKERVQIAEQAAKEELLRREKAESNEYNLRFLNEQQAHKIKSFEKFNPNLLEILERKLSLLRAEVKRLKQDSLYKSRVEWELKQEASLAHAKQQRILKKAHWGLSLAHKYGSCLLSQGQLLEGESSQEWVRLKSVLEEVESGLHKQYLALCQHVPVRPLKEAWLDDFDEEWQKGEGGGEDNGAKQLEKLIQDTNGDIISEEEEEEISEKKIEESFGEGNQQYCNRSDGISKYEETALVESEPVSDDKILCLGTQRKKNLPEVLKTSILATPAENSVRDSVHISHNTVDEASSHRVDRGGSKDGKVLTKSTSILDISAEDNESDPIPSTGCSKDGKVLTKSTSVLDTSAEDNESNSIPRDHDSVDETTPDASNTGKDINNHVILASTVDITTKDIESGPLNSAGEAGHHTSDRVVIMDTPEPTKQRSILDTSTEDSDEEIFPRSQDSKTLVSQSLEMKIMKDTMELSKSTAFLDTSLKNSEKDCNSGSDEPAPSVTSYHLDEELQAILRNMRPHEKLEDMDASSSHSSEGPGYVVKRDVHDPYMKQNLLASLSDSEEEEQKMDAHNAKDENGDEMSMPPRILTTQMSEGFSVASSHRDSSLHDDLDLSTDTLNPDDEKEEEKEIQKRVSLLHFPSTQSFSCDMEEGVPPPSSVQSPVLLSEEAEEDDDPKRQQISFQPQLQKTVDKDDKNTGPITDTLKTQNKVSLREFREMFEAVDDSSTSDERGPVDTKDKERYIEEEEEENSEDIERKLMKVVWKKTTEPQKQQKTGAVKGKNTKTVEEYTVETLEETLENVNEATVGKVERTETEEERIVEAETQRASVAEEQKNSRDKEERNLEDGKESITELEKERTSGTEEERTIGAKEEKNRKAEEGRTTDGVEERTTVVKEKDVEAMIKESTDYVGKIPCQGQERMSETVEDIPIEEEERTVPAVLEKNIKMMEERTNSEEERITDAVKGSTIVVVEKLPYAEDRATEIVKERATYTREESHTDFVGEKNYDAVRKRTTENVEKMISETAEHKTTIDAESILVNAQERTTKVLKEKNTDPVDARTTEDKTVFAVEKKCTNKGRISEAIQERIISTLEKNYNNEENNTEAIEDITTFVMEEIHIDKESSIKVAEERNSDTLEQEATDAVGDKKTENRTADADEERIIDAVEDRSTIAVEEKASETAEEKTYEAMGNKNIAVVEERTMEAVTERKSSFVEGKNSKAIGERTHITVEERTTQIVEGRPFRVMEEISTDVKQKIAEAVEEKNSDMEESAIAEEESDVRSEEGSALSTKRMMRKVLNLTQQKGKKEGGGTDDQEASCWKRRLRRQRRFEWESEAVKQEKKGRNLGGCVVRRLVAKGKLEEANKANIQAEMERRNTLKEMEDMEMRTKKMKVEEKNTSQQREGGRKQEEKVMEEESKKQEEEGKIIKQGDLRKEEEKRGKKKNEGKIKKSETEVGKKKQEKENEIKMKKKKRTLDGNVMKQVEEEVSDEREEKGRQHEEKNNQKEEAKLKEIEENRRKETEMKKEKGKEKRNHEEKGKQRNQENERQKQEEKRMQEKRKSIQEEKKQEQEKRGKEEGKSCTHEVEEKSKFELNQKEGEKRMKEEENQNKSICKGENTKKTQGRGLFWGERFADTNKGQERIIFSWSLKRTERRKLTKFNKLGKLMRVIPDPLGSQRHSVYTMECRIQPNEEQQGNRKCKKTEQPEVLQGTREGQVMCCKDGNIGKEKSFRKTNTSVLERVRGGMMNESEEDQINKENKKKCTAEEDTVKNEKALKIRRRRERNSSSSSNEEMTLCSSRELQSRNRTQQLITHPRNTTVSSSGNKVSHTRGIRQLKAKASKVSLFGLDSSSSSEVEEEKTEVKQNRKCKEKEQQQLQSLAHSRSKYCRLSMPFGSLVSEKKKAIEQVQVSRTRELSSSSSWSYSTSPVTNDSEEESITEKRGLKQPCWSQENHSDTSSESDFLQHSLTRKCKALLIVSDSDHQDDSSSTAIFQRKGRRKRKVSMSDSILIEESDCSSDSDSDHSSSGQKRHVAHHITPMSPSAHARTQTEMPRKVDTELCTDTYPQPSATLGVTPYILQRKSSTVSPGKQEKDSMPDEKRYEVEPRKCTGHHTVPEKQQNKREGIPQTDHKPNTNRESPLTLQSLNQNARKLGYGQQIMKGRARTLRKVRSAKKTTSTPSHTSKRKHSVLLLETSPQSYKRQKGSSSSVMEHKVDSSNTSDITLEPVGMDSQEEDTLILPKMKSGSFMLMAKEKYAHPQSKIVTQVLLDSSDQDQNSSLMEPESEKESELVIEENLDNCTDTSTSNLSSPCTQVTSLKTQEGLVQRVSHLGPVVFIDRPRLKPKPAPAPKVAPQTPVPAGPEYVDRLFSKLNQRTGVCSELNQISEISSLDPTQDIHSKQSTRNASLEAEGASSQSQSHPTHHSRGVDYQDQCSILLPNIYGTLGPAPTPVTSASPRHGPNFGLVHSEPTTCQPHQPTSSHISSTSEQAKASQISSMLGHSHPMPDYPHTTLDSPHPTHGQLQSTPTQPHSTPLKPSPTLGRPQPIPGHPHHTHVQPTLVSSHPYSKPGHSHPTPGQPHSTADYPIPSQPSQCSLPEPHLQSWLPEIITERVIHCGKKNQKRHPPTAIEYLKETLEEVVASRVQSRWWVMGLRKICAAITNTTLPSFLRLVLESILRSDPLEPQQHYDSLPPRLFRLFQVVCVVEQRLTPQHPNRLRSALLRAVQAIVTQSDIMIRPQSLASLSAWYVASASIDSQHEAGQEWGRGRAFLVDLLFHHPGTAHLAILTAANTCRRLFLRHVHYRGLSGLEQVLVWLAHYGAWVGRPGVRSDLTKWLAQHLNSKKPPQSPATLAKNLVTLLEPGNSKDRQWGAVVGLVVLTRWQGRPWAQKHLLPALSAATAKITTSISQEEDPGRGDLVLCEDLRNKNSHLFGNLGRALPCGLEESQTGDTVKKMEEAVNTLLSFHQ